MADEYKIYRRPSESDEWEYVDSVPAGTAEVVVAQLPETTWQWGISVVTAAGVESMGKAEVIVSVDEFGSYALPPNALVYAAARPVAGGKIEIDITYNGRGQLGVARSVQLAPLVDNHPAWGSPLATVNVGARLSHRVARPDNVFADGQIIRLVARAITADAPPGLGPVYILPLTVAQSTGPPAIEHLEASQL